MSSASLKNTNISETYTGVLHAKGMQLPADKLEYIYDGAGTTTSVMLGKKGLGVAINGGVTTTGSILLSSTISDTLTSYPRIQFGRGGGINQTTGTDSTDNIYIARLDNSWDSSELRFNIGDNLGGSGRVTDKFTVGGTKHPSTTFIPLMTLSGDGNMIVQLASHTTPYNKPTGWNGITSFDFYSDGGTIGAGSNGVAVGYFDKEGDFVGKTFSSTSSIQYKTNVKPLENALDIVNKLEGVRFDWKDTGRSDIGLIAENVNEVLPEFVMKNKDTGKPQGIDYGKITAVLIEAVKELAKLVVK